MWCLRGPRGELNLVFYNSYMFREVVGKLEISHLCRIPATYVITTFPSGKTWLFQDLYIHLSLTSPWEVVLVFLI